MIVYSLKSAVLADLFDINTETGDITSLAELDREKRSVYELPVAAIDGGGRAGFVTVRVKIADDDDNKPLFKMKEYKAQIDADAPYDAQIVKVRGFWKEFYSIFRPVPLVVLCCWFLVLCAVGFWCFVLLVSDVLCCWFLVYVLLVSGLMLFVSGILCCLF